ncbi:MAG: DUF1036 domain-containing protein [Crocinitomicaceae bacterium]|nr:DUF1036 domain-containing protein [Crocinitomicaceae bacterium]
MKNLLIIGFLVISYTANAQLYFKNNRTIPYKIAYVFYDKGSQYSGWICKGWEIVQPGEQKKVFYTNPRDKNMYCIAISDKDTITGEFQFLTNPTLEKFTLKNPDSEATKQENPELVWLNFMEIKRNYVTKFKKKLVIIIGD